MKTIAVVLALLSLGAASAYAGGQENGLLDDTEHPGTVSKAVTPVKPELLEKNYLWALGFDVDGVVEDALTEVAKMKLDYPTYDSRVIRKKVEDLAENGASPAIRYRASLTKIVFEYPELFKDDNLQSCREGEEFFAGIVRCLERARFVQ